MNDFSKVLLKLFSGYYQKKGYLFMGGQVVELWCLEGSFFEIVICKFGQRCKGGRAWELD